MTNPNPTNPALLMTRKLLVSLRDMVAEVFNLKTEDFAGIVTMTSMMPLMVEILKDPILKEALVSSLLTPEIRKAIEEYDSFTMLRKAKQAVKI